MKVAFCIREDYNTRGGGDVVQMLKTKFFLEKNFNDITIEIINSPKKLEASFDLCHIFNYCTIDITTAYFEKAKNLNIKIVSSPIYWDYQIYSYTPFCKLGFFKLNNFILKSEILITKAVNIFYPINNLISKSFRDKINFFIDNSSVILPNSEEEMQMLCSFIKRDSKSINYQVVVNASSSIEDSIEIEDILSVYNIPNNFVLQVGRIEPVKNQLSIVKALSNRKDIPIVFVGAKFHKEYYEKLKEQGDKRGNVFFISEIPHHEIYSFYKKAKLHILPSLRESPGLVTLEAMSMGCNVLVTKFPYSPYDTYFKNYAYSFDPLNTNDIREKILGILDNTYPEKDKYNNEFNWDLTAQQTYQAYKKSLCKLLNFV